MQIYNSGKLDAQVRLLRSDGQFGGYITLMPRARVTIPPNTNVDPNYLARNPTVKVIGANTVTKGK